MEEPLLRRDLLKLGTTEAEIRAALRSGRWTGIGPGVYLETGDERLRFASTRHATLVEATVPSLAPGAVVSGPSAAVRHGLPVWGVPLTTVHVTRDGASGGRGGPRLRVHASPLSADEVVDVRGIATTSVARTVVDVDRTAPFETAVAVADAALHRHLVTPDRLRDAVLAACGRHGVGRARAVVAFADARADGPGESRSRVRMARLHVVSPVLQHPVLDERGHRIGVVDFWWPDHGVVGEFDGLGKYGRSRRPGESAADAVVREKRREDALRAQPGIRTVVRWTWDELDDFAGVAQRLPRAA
ncbi:hypothetical protein [Pseudonocardia alni]|uniref:hypothetical protein n=1 Tax=Pseudonocardia alni TaxID=33907 RepID=UPI001AD61762|nr:hypothetical protein [Pseudonocardia alni]MBO4241128.1 hypothetical protein [Pseudonocardia alni]